VERWVKRDWAMWFASEGVPIVMLHGVTANGQCTCGVKNDRKHKAGKHPLRGWEPRRSTTDIERIEETFRVCPDANYGYLTASKVLVIDIDAALGGWDSMAELQAEHGPFAPSFRVLTGAADSQGRRGEHWLFANPGDVGNPKLVSGGEIDVKGGYYNGQRELVKPGYVVGPYSRHQSSRLYEPDATWRDLDHLAPLPDWLHERLRDAPVLDDAGERPPRAGERLPRVLGVVGDAVVEFDEPSVERAERVFQVLVLGAGDHAPDTTRIQRDPMTKTQQPRLCATDAGSRGGERSPPTTRQLQVLSPVLYHLVPPRHKWPWNRCDPVRGGTLRVVELDWGSRGPGFKSRQPDWCEQHRWLSAGPKRQPRMTPSHAVEPGCSGAVFLAAFVLLDVVGRYAQHLGRMVADPLRPDMFLGRAQHSAVHANPASPSHESVIALGSVTDVTARSRTPGVQGHHELH